ncbi:DUF1003 domain-containing protein [Methylopila sp. Yamaguchi]|uniref:DUF1003 domain-containing protein n=1 Tax=Methylopila sp. Yamaguchi TaxID=1437817 RepID=UPI000CC8E616|nr:DUF1003 domain-containing protein [Methylopila sp. Yamaguchi]GBD49787.1 hypothetical protein METY_3000 [Methylopila sp. Yamaguchi]
MKTGADRTDSRVTHKTANEDLSPVLDRNIGTLERRKEERDAKSSLGEAIAEKITAVSGSMAFVYIHAAVVMAWVGVNTGSVPGLAPFDPTFVILATVASVEAIFLSTFVLISQNRDAAQALRRSELDLHVNLLTERELTTLIQMVREIADKLDIPVRNKAEVKDAERNIAPEKVLDRLDRT